MVEIGAALSLAGSAFNMIKRAVESGREAEDLYNYFARFFDAKEQISEEAIKGATHSRVKKLFAGNSVEAEALQVTAARRKIAQMEQELKDFLIYTGQSDFYDEMMKERRVIRQRRIQAAKEAADRKAAFEDGIAILAAVVISAFIIGGTVVLITSV
jgi:hypothetical protein